MAAPNLACVVTSPLTTLTLENWSGASTPSPVIHQSLSKLPFLQRPRKLGAANGGGTVWDSIAYDPALDFRLPRRRQRNSLEPPRPQSSGWRQSFHLLCRRPQGGHRRICLALSGNSWRRLGFR